MRPGVYGLLTVYRAALGQGHICIGSDTAQTAEDPREKLVMAFMVTHGKLGAFQEPEAK